ncbi:MAG: hypothetical protein ACFCBW_08895 [Candidatus Competibacterales bacterium]
MDELRQLCRDGRTGRYILFTPNNVFAHMDIDAGRITWVAFANASGSNALDRWRDEGRGEGSFVTSSPTGKLDDTLPANEGIFHHLLGGENAATASGKSLTEAQGAQIRALLTKRVGPMAKMLFDDALQDAPTADDAIEAMASNIPAPKEAAAFVAEARRVLETVD